MPSLPTTWQMLPEWLLEPVMNQHLTLAQATGVWDNWLMTPEDQFLPLPPDLWPAAQTLMLLETDPPSQARH